LKGLYFFPPPPPGPGGFQRRVLAICANRAAAHFTLFAIGPLSTLEEIPVPHQTRRVADQEGGEAPADERLLAVIHPPSQPARQHGGDGQVDRRTDVQGAEEERGDQDGRKPASSASEEPLTMIAFCRGTISTIRW